MKNKDKIRKLTWKYFQEQKLKEISITILIVLLLTIVPYFLGSIIGDGIDEQCGNDIKILQECDIMDTWAEGFFYLIVLFFVGCFFFAWIGTNWDKAKDKAEREVKNGKK